jgi:hypothetical protein
MTAYGNPFTEQTQGRYFVGREDELDIFRRGLRGLEQGLPSHAFVAGLHGTGKSFFLDKLIDIARAEGFIGVLTTIDEGASARGSVGKILRATVDAVQGSAYEHEAPLTDDWDLGARATLFRQARQDEPDSDAILEDVRKLVGIAKSAQAKGIVVCIDEGQRLPPAALSALKNAFQREHEAVIVVSLRLATAEGGPRKAGRVRLDEIANAAEGDIGASRLFVTEYGMGPFATHDEARKCITKRLEDGHVSFDPGVITDIVSIAELVPRAIITYASKVWEAAAGLEPPHATAAMLGQVMSDLHSAELDAARIFVARQSGPKRALLGALLACGGAAAVDEIVNRLVPTDESDSEMLERTANYELGDLASDYAGIQGADGRFLIARAVDVFALRLALIEET